MLQGGSSAEPSGAKLMISPGAIYSVPWLSAQTAQGSLRLRESMEEQTRASFIQVQGGLGYGVNMERTR